MKKEKIVITVLGVNKSGVVANVTSVLAKYNCSIQDMNQTIIDDLFAMILIVDITDLNMDFAAFKEKIEGKGEEIGVKIFIQHENVFRMMHRI
ncbi:MAG: ACT domain-containing protein [Candidatus Muirbacterium halophilum]|nr:ACT domain-containing protein [Candidatus Muirbacterium halophilum]MCK9475443.1 ACT domain-containing protein [Candidatus Muirbacterium halophilum]